MDDRPLDLENFFEAAQEQFHERRQAKAYKLLSKVDKLYGAIHEAGVFAVQGPEAEMVVHMAFFLCHRALLSAAVATLSGNPEDSPASTRRALEAAKLVLAIKANPVNFDAWKASTERIERWELRIAQGTDPGEVSRH